MIAHFVHEPKLELFESNLGYVLEYFVGLGGAEIVVEFLGTDAQRYDLQQLGDIGLLAPIERDVVDRDASLEWPLFLLTKVSGGLL